MSNKNLYGIQSYTFDIIDGRMYVITGGDEAVIIDPHESREAAEDIRRALGYKYIREQESGSGCETGADTGICADAGKQADDGICAGTGTRGKVYIILTHSHFDHVSGVNYYKERFNCEVICSKRCGEIIDNPKNDTRKFPFLFVSDKEKFGYVKTHFKFPYLCSATMTFTGEMELKAAGHTFLLKEIGGHCDSSIAIIMDGGCALFTGDNLLANGKELAFSDADKDSYEKVCLPFFVQFENTDAIVYPGHGHPHPMKYFLDLAPV